MIPKNITGKELIKKLRIYGYQTIRQSGSHIRIQTEQNGRHSETIPNHNPIKIGTLRKILKNISSHLDISIEDVENKLFN